MQIEIISSAILAVLALSLRIGLFFFYTPFDLFGYMPAKVKLLMVLSFSFFIVAVLGLSLDIASVGVIGLLIILASELLTGFILVLGLYCVTSALSIAGRLLDLQTGFAAAGLFNPSVNSQEPLFGVLLTWLGGVWFFLSGLHHYVLRLWVVSLEYVPLGGMLKTVPIEGVVAIITVAFSFGIMIAMPILLVLYLVDTAVAILGKTMPQMNVYFLFMPLKVLVSLVMAALLMRFMSPIYEKLFLQLHSYWQSVLMV